MRKIFRLVLFIIVVLVLNAGLNFIIISATEPHRLQNHELYSNINKYEIIGLGPSDCLSHFDAPEASELLGKKCFNYGQVGTLYKTGAVESSFENALSCQSPSKVLFFVAHDNLYKDTDEKEPAQTYIHATGEMTNKLAKAKYYFKSSKGDGALERIFQWKYILEDEKMPTFSEMKDNVNNKLTSEYRNYDVDWRNSIQKNTIYAQDGFVGRATRDHYDDAEEPNYTVDLTEYDGNLIVSQDEVDGYDLDDMISVCKEKDIEPIILMGIMSPEIICEEGPYYEELSKTLAAIAKKNDVQYFDLNYIKKEYYRPEYSDWSDSTHLDIYGAKRYTQALCMVLNSYFDGENTDKYFYNNLREMLDTYDNITIIMEKS